ncbi:MAG TPA: TIGR03067 domain-containing protein [Gemmataceae bacterium]|nr:TIGR03067 domain-containing protein [Gemmataceae bacterium]
MRVVALLVLSGILIVAAGAFPLWAAEEDKDNGDRAKLEGTWKLVSYEEDGKAMSAEDVKKVSLMVKGDKFTLKLPEETVEGSSKRDATKKPKEIDTTPAKGRFEGKTLLGIYELSDDTYKACFAPPGKDRPKEFSSKKESGNILFVFKREKAKP